MRVPESSLPSGGRRNYPLSVKLDAVRAVEAGEQQRAVSARLGIHTSTLLDWLRHYGTAAYAQRKRRVFSPALKRQVVDELLASRLTYPEAQRKYGLRYAKTLRTWVAAHHAESAAPAVPMPPPAEAVAPPASPTAAELAAHLQHARWQVEALTTLIEQAEATYRIEIRKKAGAKQST